VITLLMLAVGGAVAGALVYFRRRAHAATVAGTRAHAARRGWRYVEHYPGLVDRFTGTPFGRGHEADAKHMLDGTHRGRRMLAFEYVVKDGQGAAGDAGRRYTVVSAALPWPKPTLEVTRKGRGRTLLAMAGAGGPGLGDEEFTRAFHVRTDDEGFARAVLHPGMTRWLLADGRAQAIPFRFEGGDLIAWDERGLTPSTVDSMLDFLCDVLDRVPPSAWKA
jgi:hypothetical protein